MKSLSNRKDPNENPDVMFKTRVLDLEGEMAEFGLDVGAFRFGLAARVEVSFVSRLAEEVLRGPGAGVEAAGSSGRMFSTVMASLGHGVP